MATGRLTLVVRFPSHKLILLLLTNYSSCILSEFLVMFAMQKDAESDYVAAFRGLFSFHSANFSEEISIQLNIFIAMDKDGDGFVDHSDMKEMLGHLGINLTDGEAKNLMQITDLNKVCRHLFCFYLFLYIYSKNLMHNIRNKHIQIIFAFYP